MEEPTMQNQGMQQHEPLPQKQFPEEAPDERSKSPIVPEMRPRPADVPAEQWSAVDPQALGISFPRRLYNLLEHEDASIISWTGDGKAFRIHNPSAFCNSVLLKYFRHCKLTSFQRQLNLYGFTHVSKGPLTGSYLHPLFFKGNKDNLDVMKRLPRKDSKQQSQQAPNQAAYTTPQMGMGGPSAGFHMPWGVMSSMPGSMPGFPYAPQSLNPFFHFGGMPYPEGHPGGQHPSNPYQQQASQDLRRFKQVHHTEAARDPSCHGWATPHAAPLPTEEEKGERDLKRARTSAVGETPHEKLAQAITAPIGTGLGPYEALAERIASQVGPVPALARALALLHNQSHPGMQGHAAPSSSLGLDGQLL